MAGRCGAKTAPAAKIPFPARLPSAPAAAYLTPGCALTGGAPNANAVLNLTGPIGGSGGVNKNGPGTVVITNAANNWSGGTHVNAGTLVNNGALPSAVSVESGAMLKGSGTFAAITLDSGGVFSPGNSPGLSTMPQATWNGGGIYRVEMADASSGAGTGWDNWSITNQLTIGATPDNPFLIDLDTLGAGGLAGNATGFDSSSTYDWLIASSPAGTLWDLTDLNLDVSGFLNPHAGQFSLSSQDNQLFVHYSVPEPDSLVLCLSGLALLASYYKLRRGAPSPKLA